VRLALPGCELDLFEPVLMGIVNAGPDSFSERPGERRLSELVELGLAQAAAGAAIVDVGGESGRTDTEAVPVGVEIERVVPLVEALTAAGIAVSVDTWRPPVARAALDAGAAIVNDVSGLADERLAGECAAAGAALVVTHTRAEPKTKAFPRYGDVVADVRDFLAGRAAAAMALGLRGEQVIVDPGLDLAKSPSESVRLLRELPRAAPPGHPLLVAASRKDFVGALTGRRPADRDAGTLAALGVAVDGGARILRVHDVAAARDHLRVHLALRGHSGDAPLELPDHLRREAV
jgi:dihydropteroate synthase